MKFLREATPVQRIMAICMGIALGSLLVWAVFELMGVFSEESEDTWTEWVVDQNFFIVAVISGLGVLAGILLIGSAWHFLENYKIRRDIERRVKGKEDK